MCCPFILLLTLLVPTMPGAAPRTGETIHSARELYRAMFLKSDSASSFAITATVSSVNFEDRHTAVELALSDDTGAVGVIYDWRKLSIQPRPGDRVRAVGHITALHGWKRQGELAELEVLSPGDAPVRRRRTIQDLLSGRYDFQPVRVQGTVRDVIRGTDNPQWTALGLVDGGSALVVPVHANEADFRRLDELIGQEVLVDGFCSPTDPGLLHTGRQIRICDPHAIQRVQTQSEPLSPPSIDALSNLSPDTIACLGLHSASGTVIAVWQDRHALIRTASDMAIRLSLRSPAPPHVGDIVEATGFPESNFISFTLLHATVRTLGRVQRTDERPESLSLRPPFDGKDDAIRPTRVNHGRLVRVRGRVGPIFGDKGRRWFHISGKDGVLRIEAEPLAEALDQLVPGSEIKLTGVCVLEAVAWHAIRPLYTGVLVVPRSVDDLRILARPSIWTPRRFCAVIGALFAILLGILVWNLALRRAALRKGRELLHEQIRQLKAETKTLERTRLAVELHDSLAQNLTGVSLEIAAAERCVATDNAATMKHLAFASKALNSCRSSLRDNLWDLRSHALEAPDVDTAIRQTLLPHLKGVTLDIRFAALRSRLPDNILHDILCIVRELAVNGIRHGGATQIAIVGRVEGRRVLFSVADNGSGFDPAHSPGVAEGHYGLQGIRERLRNLHGTLAFERGQPCGAKADIALLLPDT